MPRLPPNPWTRAACVVDAAELISDHDFAYPQGAGLTRNQHAREFIRRYCDHCPVIAMCGEYGKDEEVGIWGGRTEEERASIRHLVLILL
jgi:hypothetical protein